jgi:hypothetical protein
VPAGARPTVATVDGDGFTDGEAVAAAEGDDAWLGTVLGEASGGAELGPGEAGGDDGAGDAAAVQPTEATRAAASSGTIQRRDRWCGAMAVIGFPLWAGRARCW